MIFLATLVLALACLVCSAFWTYTARRRRRHMTDLGVSSAHQLGVTFALWAIAIILLDLAIR